MLKIPELPIYNTERYGNYSPISPDDFAAGQIYTNDVLFIYISYLSFNKTATYMAWDKQGEYVRRDMYSSKNIYAIVTFLNNNKFRLLDYDFEVVDPYNSDKKILLTPSGIKKIKPINESYLRKKIRKITEDCIKKLVKEGTLNDTEIESDEDKTELSSFDEYKMDYPNDDFDVSDITPKELARWCDNIGDFLFIYKGLRGLKIMAANSSEIVDSIIDDLNKCESIEPSHEVDYLFEKHKKEFVNDYVCIFKIKGSPHGDYYVVYQKDKTNW